MDVEATTGEGGGTSRNRFSFGIGNLLMLIAFVAVCIAWWGDNNRKVVQEYDILGPLTVSYSVRTSPTSTSGSQIKGVNGIDFEGDNIILYTAAGGMVLPGNSLIRFNWSPE